MVSLVPSDSKISIQHFISRVKLLLKEIEESDVNDDELESGNLEEIERLVKRRRKSLKEEIT